jgi:hypothetical protein
MTSDSKHAAVGVAVAPDKDNGLGSGHQQVRLEWGPFEATVDSGISEDILALWKAGFPTSYSCQGGLWGTDGWCERYVVVSRRVSDSELDELVVLLPWAVDVDPRSFSLTGKSIVRLGDGGGHWKSPEQLEGRIALLRRHQARYAAALGQA